MTDRPPLSQTTGLGLTEDELMLLNAIDHGQNEPGINFAKYEILIPYLIKRGLVTQHTVWRLTDEGESMVRRVWP